MKIRLTKFESVPVSERWTIIDEENRVYREGERVLPFGSIFIESFNTYLTEAEEAEEEMIQTEESVGFWSAFDPVPVSSIIESINEKELSSELKTAIEQNTETIPFGVGIYSNQPALILKGSPDMLLFFDLLKIFELRIKIGLCSNCGRAFIRSTQDRYCEVCKDGDAKKERIRQLNAKRNQNPALIFQNTIRHRKEYHGKDSAYYTLISRRCPAEIETSVLNEWKAVDVEYRAARKTYLEMWGRVIDAPEEEWEKTLLRDWSRIITPADLRVWLSRMK